MAKKKYKPLLSKAEKQVKRRKVVSKMLLVLLTISIITNYILIKKINIPFVKDMMDENVEVFETSTQMDEITEIVHASEESNHDYEPVYLVESIEDIDRIIVEQLNTLSTEITVTYKRDNYLADEFNVELLDILNNHPEYFWTRGGGNWDKNRSKFYDEYMEYTLQLGLTCDEKNIVNMNNQLNNVVDLIVSQASKLDSDYEKVKYVHDYVVNNTTYDYQGYEAIMNDGEVDELTGTAYGNLVNKTSVCEGYAEAFKLIMDRLNIECGVLSGIGTNELATGPHAWNYVKIDDEYYFVDVTWDDPVSDDGEQILSYDYFCINYDQISKDHTFDSDQFVPECTSTKYMDILMEE